MLIQETENKISKINYVLTKETDDLDHGCKHYSLQQFQPVSS